MKYSIEELRKAFVSGDKIVAEEIQRYCVVVGHSVLVDGPFQATHKFKLSDGYGPIIITSTKEEQQMKPAEIIKQEKQVLEQSIREACKKFLEQGIKDACKEFVTATGVAVPSIEVDFDSRETLSSSPHETHICRVSVDYADI